MQAMSDDKKINTGQKIPEEQGQQPSLTPQPPLEKEKAKELKPGGPQEKVVLLQESEYLKLKQEIGDARDRYLRLQAEFDNVRKRVERERMEFIKYANEGIIQQFLFAVDDLERTIEAAKANHQDYMAFLKGIEMVMTQIYDMLKKNNVKPIEAKGKKFDPHYHEALMTLETNEVAEGTVVEEFQKGYMIGERVVRTAKVKVATAKTVKETATDTAGKITKKAKEDHQNSRNQ